MDAEKISILLEVVSFFFVTLDLFGKERLGDLHNRISEMFNQKEKVRILQYFYKEPGESVLQVLCFILVIWGMFEVYERYGIDLISYRHGLMGAIEERVIFFSSFGLAYLILTNILVIIELLVNATLGSIVKLLRHYKLDGIMLTIGAILFLISKIVSFVN